MKKKRQSEKLSRAENGSLPGNLHLSQLDNFFLKKHLYSLAPKPFMNFHSHIAIVVRPLGGKTLCRSLVICKGFFRMVTPTVIWRVFQFCKEIWFGLWSCYLRMAFLDGDNFCKAFAGALVNMSYHSWLRHSSYDKSRKTAVYTR